MSHTHNMSHKHTINHGHTATGKIKGDLGGSNPCMEYHESYGSGDYNLSNMVSVIVNNHNGYSSYDLYDNNSTPGKITNTGNSSTSNTGDTGNTETRPINYTVKLWKRTA